MDEREPPTWIIPPGTQVVLKAAKRIPHTKDEKPAGSVGQIVRSPRSNRFAYVVQFPDGAKAHAKFGELVVRRREVLEELGAARESLMTPGEDLTRFVIYRCSVGSRAFGLAVEGSDEDIRGIYLPPAAMTWSLVKPPEQWESAAAGRDEVYWELEKFLLLALQANPSVLETLWTPIVHLAAPLGEELRGMRSAFLSKHIYKTYSGYALSQFQRMRAQYERTGTFKAKHAMHIVRLLLSGVHALRTGDILVDVGEHREELLAIRSGALSFDAALARANELVRAFQEAFPATRLPDQPDYARANAFLVRARRSMVDG